MSVRQSALVWDLDLPSHLKLVALAVADHANDEGVCWPSQDRLAAMCGVKPRALRDSLRRLEELGLLTTTLRGHQRTALYQLTLTGSTLPPTGRQSTDGDQQPTATEPGSPLPRNHQEPSGEPPQVGRPELPAMRLARAWAAARGVPATRSVLKRWVPQVQHYLDTAGQVPSTEDLAQWCAAGIREPSGWAFVGRLDPWPVWVPAHILQACQSPDATVDPRWRKEYDYGPQSPVPAEKQPTIRAKAHLLGVARRGGTVTESMVVATLKRCHQEGATT